MTTTDNAWRKPDDFASPTSGGALSIAVLAGVALAAICTVILVGKIDGSDHQRAAQGFTVIFTAFGAAMVALGLAVRQWEPAKEADVRYKEAMLQLALNQRPDLSAGPLGEDAAKRDSARQSQQELEDSRAHDVVVSKKKAARLRSVVAGVEFAGALVLLVGAVIGVVAWDLF